MHESLKRHNLVSVSTVYSFFCLCLMHVSPARSADTYGFTLSADSTDAWVQTAAQTSGLREIYLWLVCTTDGISAFEAGVSGSGFPLAFVPHNGTINAGSANELLLAIPGCPLGDPNLLVGHWLVIDSGIDLCLEPSSQNGLMAGVDCAVVPELSDLVTVFGFSSSGTPPCIIKAPTDCDDLGDDPVSTHAASWGAVKASFRPARGR